MCWTTTRSERERSPRSRSFGSTAATQTRLETRSVPTSSRWPAVTKSRLDRAEIMLAHVLTWSVRTERARVLLETRHRQRREHDERAGASAHWFLALVEMASGSMAASRGARRAAQTAIGVQYGILAPFRRVPARSRRRPSRRPRRARGSSARLGRELADRGRRSPRRAGGHRGHRRALERRSGAAAAWFAKGEAAADAAGWREPNLRWWRADYAEALIALGRTTRPWRCWTRGRSDAARVGRQLGVGAR